MSEERDREEGDTEELPIEQLLERAMGLAATLAEADDDSARTALELLDLLEAWHREGLLRLAMALPDEAMDAIRADPVVAHLLDVYLAEDDADDVQAVVAEVLEELRPYLESHGGDMQIVEVDVEMGEVTLALKGACDGCTASPETLAKGVEEALEARWSGFQRLTVHDAAPLTKPPPQQQLVQIQPRPQG